MTDRLIIQSHTPRPDQFEKYLALSRPIHEAYAKRCDADYELFVGWKEADVNPTWNRLPMILDAFANGYEKVVWLDADTIVTNPARDIFAEVAGAPLHMTRTSGFPWWTPDGEREAWNDGVLVAERGPEATAALEWVWARRHDPFLAHQISGMPELSWLLDYVFTQPDTLVKELADVWNWMPFAHASPRAGAVIEAFHGQRYGERWENFQSVYREFYG